MNKQNKKGFTLVELVIVIAVIAILSAILIPTFSNVIQNANESKAQSEVKNAITAYISEDPLTADERTTGVATYYYAYDGELYFSYTNGVVEKIDAIPNTHKKVVADFDSNTKIVAYEEGAAS